MFFFLRMGKGIAVSQRLDASPSCDLLFDIVDWGLLTFFLDGQLGYVILGETS